jgi:hypothetical protein
MESVEGSTPSFLTEKSYCRQSAEAVKTNRLERKQISKSWLTQQLKVPLQLLYTVCTVNLESTSQYVWPVLVSFQTHCSVYYWREIPTGWGPGWPAGDDSLLTDRWQMIGG